MTAITCPSAEELRRCASGLADETDAERVLAHVEICPSCQAAADALLCAGDSLLGAPRLGAAAGASATDPALAAALRRMEAPGGETWPTASRTGDAPPDAPAPAELPDVPGYEVLAEHGRGGMGVVYRARQRALNRPVALKMVLAAELASPEQVLRFRLEAEMAARVRHPNIVQVYEVGEWHGRPFLALEWVEGGTLAERLRGGPLPPREAADLTAALARAVQAAHAEGVIHRDLKPANVLLSFSGRSQSGAADAPLCERPLNEAVPKIIDFGLARSTEGGGLTQTGAVVGTPEYMAPEQAAGRKQIGTAVDVYALGALLYELLTGRPPFRGGTTLETLRQVVEQEPRGPRSLQAGVPHDLETICLKCLQKDPARRYRSAAALADDLARFRNGEPIAARRVGDLERAWKWARRRPAVAALLLAVVAALLGGTAVSTYFWRQASLRAEQAERAGTAATAARTAAEGEKRSSDRQAADLLFDRAAQLADQGEPDKALHLWLECLRIAPDDAADLRRAARISLAAWEPRTHRLRAVLRAPVQYYGGFAISPDGALVVTSSRGGKVWRWDGATGRLLGPPIQTRDTTSWGCSLTFSPDGGTFLTGDATGSVQRWDARTGEAVGRPLQNLGAVIDGVAYSPDGTVFAVTAGEKVRTYEAATGRLLEGPILTAARAFAIAFSPDGRRLAVGLKGVRSGSARVWDRAHNDWVGPPLPHPDEVFSVAFTPDGKQVLTGCGDGALRRWDASTGRPVGDPLWHPDPVRRVAATPDGSTLVTGCQDNLVRFWDAVTGTPAGAPVRSSNPHTFTLDSSGRLLLTGAGELWELGRGPSRPVPAVGAGGLWRMPSADERVSVALSPDARLVAVSGLDGTVRVAEVATGRPVGPPLRPLYPQTRAQAFSPDGRRLVTACNPPSVAGAVRAWDVATGEPLTPWLPQRNHVPAVAFAPDGKLFAAGDYSGGVTLWDATTGRPAGPRLAQRDIVLRVAISPDGRRLAAGTASDHHNDPQTRLWDMATQRPVGEPLHHVGYVVFLVFRPDSRALLCSSPSTTYLVDAETAAPIGAPLPHVRELTAAAFSPDGRVLVTADADGRLRLWDGASGRSLPRPPMTHGQEVSAVAFSPDGATLAAGCKDGTARLWDVATSKPLGPPVVLRRQIQRVAFSPDGRSFVTVARDGTVRSWPVPAPDETPLEELTLRVQARTRLALDVGQALAPLDDEAWEERRRQADGTTAGAAIADADWHDARARDAEDDDNAPGAGWHLERLAALRPDDWLVHARLGAARVGAGDLTAARAACDRADALGKGALSGWYRHRAVACLRPGQWGAALWYLDRLAAAGADDWELHARRAQALHELGRTSERDAAEARAVARGPAPEYLRGLADAQASAGRWTEAAALFAAANRRGDDLGLAYPQVLATLKAGDPAGYRAVCDRLLAALPAPGPDLSPDLANNVASLCALGPDGPTDGKRLTELIDHALARGPGPAPHAFLNTRGMVYYRAGRFKEAVASLDQARQSHDAGGVFHDFVFLAMAHHALKDEAKARQWLDKARGARKARPKDVGTNWWDGLEEDLLTAEAERLIRPAKQP